MIALVDGHTAALIVTGQHFKVHGRTLESAVKKLKKSLPKERKPKS
ncbi:MAG: hypothetical protein ACE15B_19370 [Bryobacteraceae bacterium]